MALIVTDAYAFNTLSRGQLEYFTDEGLSLDLYCGGATEQIDKLRQRSVGRVIPLPLRRQPHPWYDFLALVVLTWHLLTKRYTTVVYSTPKAMLLGSIAAFCSGQKRRICFVRGRAYETMTGRKRRVYLGMDRLAFRLSNDVIFLSESLAQAYREDSAYPEIKARVLGHGSSNGVDLDRFRNLPAGQRSALRQEIGLSIDDFLIIIAGRIVPDKGIKEALTLIDMLSDRADLRWLFVGWPESVELTNQIRAREKQGVIHRDHADNIELLLGMSDLSFLPSYREGFGNVGIEAAACGIPTLAFDVVGLRDSVADGITGALVRFGDLDACAQFIRTAADNPEALRARYPDLREWVADRFEQREVWRRYADAYVGKHNRD